MSKLLNLFGLKANLPVHSVRQSDHQNFNRSLLNERFKRVDDTLKAGFVEGGKTRCNQARAIAPSDTDPSCPQIQSQRRNHSPVYQSRIKRSNSALPFFASVQAVCIRIR